VEKPDRRIPRAGAGAKRLCQNVPSRAVAGLAPDDQFGKNALSGRGPDDQFGKNALSGRGPDDQFGKNALSGLGACPAAAGSAEAIHLKHGGRRPGLSKLLRDSGIHGGSAASLCRKLLALRPDGALFLPSPRPLGGVRSLDPDGVHRTPEIGEGGPPPALSPAGAGRVRGSRPCRLLPT
jgi:hypothetical protein